MSAPTPNAALAYQVLDKALAHREHFDMGTWGHNASGVSVGLDDLTGEACGTTACFAGWTAAMAGYRVGCAAQLWTAEGEHVDGEDAVDVARRLLGITDGQASDLFYSGSRVAQTVAEIFGPRPDGGEGEVGKRTVTP